MIAPDTVRILPRAARDHVRGHNVQPLKIKQKTRAMNVSRPEPHYLVNNPNHAERKGKTNEMKPFTILDLGSSRSWESSWGEGL
jgi:hypothetical protein